MNQKDMQYLGDGVYVGNDGFQLWLTVGSHESPELLALDPNVLINLVRYAKDKLGIDIT